MTTLLVCVAAFAASGLTLFAGFGLGTLLMPVVALFFPLELAIAMTAIVHLANNLFKLALLGRQADGGVVLRFGGPAVAAAFVGAGALAWMDRVPPLFSYEAFGRRIAVSLLGLVIGALIIAFVVVELSPRFARIAIARRWLPVGGVLSGFFGGLSGHQGAFRSMFLLKAGLDKEAFVATGVVIAVLVDVARLLVYGAGAATSAADIRWSLVGAACAAAFLGAYAGTRLLRKVTLQVVQRSVAVLLVLVAAGLMAGVV